MNQKLLTATCPIVFIAGMLVLVLVSAPFAAEAGDAWRFSKVDECDYAADYFGAPSNWIPMPSQRLCSSAIPIAARAYPMPFEIRVLGRRAASKRIARFRHCVSPLIMSSDSSQERSPWSAPPMLLKHLQEPSVVIFHMRVSSVVSSRPR